MERSRHAALFALTVAGIVICMGIAHADPPISDDSPAARRQRFLNQGDSGSQSTPSNSDSSPAPGAAPATSSPTPAEIWAGAIEPLPAGGWQYFASSASGSDEFIIYVSTHNVLVRGSIVTAWFRWEYMAPQTYAGYLTYRGEVVRTEIDCETSATRDLAGTFYSDNNLDGATKSQVADPKTAQWSPAVPGTIGEFMVEWGCAKLRSQRR